MGFFVSLQAGGLSAKYFMVGEGIRKESEDSQLGQQELRPLPSSHEPKVLAQILTSSKMGT